MGVLVSFSTLVRMVAFGFALGIIVGLYFGISGRDDTGSATCPPAGTTVERCQPDTSPPVTTVNPDAAP
jgi:hypothetical protein